MAAIMTQTLISRLFVTYKIIMNASIVALVNLAMLQRFYGYEKLSHKIKEIIVPTIEIIFMTTLFIFINQNLHNLSLDICIEANKTQMEMKVIRRLQQEF